MHRLRIGEEEQRADDLLVEIHAEARGLLADAKRAENFPEDFLAVGLAHDLTDSIERAAQFLGDELRRQPVRQRGRGPPPQSPVPAADTRHDAH